MKRVGASERWRKFGVTPMTNDADKAAQITKARKHLRIANRQWNDASTAWFPPTDAADCVSKCFYAFENAVVAAATVLDIEWKKTHPDKIRVAGMLVKNGHVKSDVRDRLA